MKKIEGVIFDLDGTIANTLPLCISAFRKAIEPLVNRPLTDKEIIATFGPSEEGTVKALAPDQYEQGIESYLKYYKDLHPMCSEPFPGITELLEVLLRKNVNAAMVTGKGKHSTKISLDIFNCNKYFQWIETGSPNGPRKPEGIREILQHWPDIKKEHVVYIGDAPSDIRASREAGIPVVAACWAETADPAKMKGLQPDHIFYDVPNFSKWLLQLV